MRANWWLRDVVSATNFANVNNNGNANYNNASNGNGIRPDFGSADKTSEIGIALHRKERLSVPKGEKTARAIAEPPRAGLPYAARYVEPIAGA